MKVIWRFSVFESQALDVFFKWEEFEPLKFDAAADFFSSKAHGQHRTDPRHFFTHQLPFHHFRSFVCYVSLLLLAGWFKHRLLKLLVWPLLSCFLFWTSSPQKKEVSVRNHLNKNKQTNKGSLKGLMGQTIPSPNCTQLQTQWRALCVLLMPFLSTGFTFSITLKC